MSCPRILKHLYEYTSKEETRLEALGDRMLMRIMESKEQQLTGGGRN
jgi:hypothetical protein